MRALLWTAAFFAVAFALVALKLSHGVPDKWTDRLGEALSSEDVDVEPAKVSFSLSRMALRVGSVGVYRKRVLREPVARATGIEVRFKPSLFKPPTSWLESLHLDSLDLDIDTSGDGEDEDESGDSAASLPDIAPFAFSCGRVSVLGLRPHDVSATLSCTGGVLRVDAFTLRFPEEKATGQTLSGGFFASLEPFALGADASGRLDPNVVAPVLRNVDEPEIAAELEKFRFDSEAPHIGVSYRYCPSRNERKLHIHLGSDVPARYNGVAVDSFSGVVEVGAPESWSHVAISPLNVSRPEGSASASLEILPREDELRFRADATMDAVALAAMIGLLDADDTLPVSMERPAQIRAQGVFSIGPAATNSLGVEVFAPVVGIAGVDYERASAEMTLTGDVLSVPRIRADVLGGDFSGSFSVRLPLCEDSPTNMPASISMHAKEFSHEEWAKLLGMEAEGSKGVLDASVLLDGPLDDIVSLEMRETTGIVDVAIRDSRIFRVPVFAGLTDILASVVPGVDLLVDEDNVTVKGEFSGGKLRIDPFNIDGAAFSLSGKGNVYFPDCELDLKVKVHLLNRSTWVGEGVYWLLSPLSKMLEIRATGPATSPRWTSATFQSNPSKK